jgi:hypothetical protein
MKINEIVSETTAGGIATVAMPMGNMIKRPNPSVFAISKPKLKKKKKTKKIETKDESS